MFAADHKAGMPWQSLLQISFGILHTPPSVFWQMTPVEWAVMLKEWKSTSYNHRPSSVLRDEINRLAKQFPDLESGTHDHS